MKIVPNTKGVWLTVILYDAVLFIFLFIPMQWGAPTGPVRMMTRTVQIIPNVSGQVIDIPVEANTPLNQGDLLFQIDPEPFQQAVDLAAASLVRVKAQTRQDLESLDSAKAQLRQAQAQRVLAQSRFDDDSKLVESGTISENRLELRTANLDAAIGTVEAASAAVRRLEVEIGAVTEEGVIAKVAEAQTRLEQAQWNLEQTSVRAPGEGYVTNLALAEGQRVTNLPFMPAMAFVDTSERLPLAEIHQIYLRHVRPGQEVEIAIKTQPGRLITGTVDRIVPAVSRGQALNTGSIAASGNIVAEPFLVRLNLDAPEELGVLPPGAVGAVAIYTESVTSTHVIRRVMIRMTSIINYLNPAL
ncbi:HlyD family secretion protein [Pseudophaeobacter sp.]|uniref:HlyD family secretion protein n=1 Tax=Pseudophaeobacter sp. TaxID=1971739 RepID=UPI003296860C